MAEAARMAAEEKAKMAEDKAAEYKKMAADADAARMEAERQLAIAEGTIADESAADVAARADKFE